MEVKKKLIVDPPSGWKYGFPCEWNKQLYPHLDDLLRAKGYPEDEIDSIPYVRTWYAEN